MEECGASARVDRFVLVIVYLAVGRILTLYPNTTSVGYQSVSANSPPRVNQHRARFRSYYHW